MKPNLALLTALLLAVTLASAADSGAPFAPFARPQPRANGAPKASDVCLSTRWPRPMNPSDKWDSFQAARRFHATRLDWLYLSGNPDRDKAFVAKFKAAGFLVGGTLNGLLPDSPTATKRAFTLARTVDMKGEPLKDPWTEGSGARWGCPNHPGYAKLFLEHARYALDAGVDHFQMDGVQLNDIMLHYGGCFCTHCVKGFREYLGRHSTGSQRTEWGIGDLAAFDYAQFLLGLGTAPDRSISAWKGPRELRELFRAFQIESGLGFLREMHREIDRIAGRKLAYSCNATSEFLTDYYQVHDFALNETYPATEGDPAFLYEQRLRPAATVPAAKLLTGATPAAPAFGATLINGRPGVRFDGVDDQLAVPGFANACLAGKPFTVFLVTQSDDAQFGICGNAANGSGGIPRWYLTRGSFSYDRIADSIPVAARLGAAAVTVYQHDGIKTASARSGGCATGKRDDLPVVEQFGGGGNLAMPFWSGVTNHAGNLGEIINYDRHLTVAEIEAVEEELALRYGVGDRPRWR